MANRTSIFSPEGEQIKSRILKDIDAFDDSGRVIYKGHNLIKVFGPTPDINIKRYGVPKWYNRIIYSFIRKPKGERAFYSAGKLRDAGIFTPLPLAFVKEQKYGLIGLSYLVTLHEYGFQDGYLLGDDPIMAPSRRQLVKEIAALGAVMHNAGLLHKDFSPGNILWRQNPHTNAVEFCLVDINRMRFGKVSVKKGAENFARLWGQPELFRLLAEEYARLRGADPVQTLKWMSDARNRFWRKFSKRHRVKYRYLEINIP